MRVLVGCEESQAVTIELRKLGHEAYSCDTQPCTGGYPEWHIQGDVLEQLNKGWDMGIFFPPCTYLANCGLHYLKTQPGRKEKHAKAVKFFLALYNSPIDKVAIENPVGWMNTNWRKPDQIIQPYYFGTPELKTTCLWLKDLPLLEYRLQNDLFGDSTAVDRPKPRGSVMRKTGSKKGQPYNYYFRQGKTAKQRSKTFQVVANAMANQWG